MEIANDGRATIRVAEHMDSRSIMELVRHASFSHIHADWRLPIDWLGSPTFVLFEREDGTEGPFGCLAATADPPPAAWVRLAALKKGHDPVYCIGAMLETVLPSLKEIGVEQVGWLMTNPWPESWFRELKFQRVNEIITYQLDDLYGPEVNLNWIHIRTAKYSDIASLTRIEEAAFEPLWRHSIDSLRLAWKQATSFDVVIFGEDIVGFQYSVAGYRPSTEHLVRIMVHPAMQGYGIGSALMTHALAGYKSRGIEKVTLNTQQDNLTSQRLYERFGFRPLGDRLPVWARLI